jgi:hypothetical protein
MKLPGSVRPFLEGFDNDIPSTTWIEHVHMNIPHTVFPQIQSRTRFLQVFSSSRLETGSPESLSYTVTLWTMEFFKEWTPPAYRRGILQNDAYWNALSQFYSRHCSVPEVMTLMAMTQKSHQYILPFLRTGKVPPSFVQRARKWRSLYGFFPLYFHMKPGTNSYQDFVHRILPDLPLHRIEEGVQNMVEWMDALFAKAPPLSHPLVVFRGIKQFDFGPPRGYQTWTDPAYVSTTLHPLHAFSYKNPTGPCCVQRLTIPASCKVLLLQGLSNFENEWELLLPRSLVYKKIREKEIQIPFEHEWNQSPPTKFQSVLLQEIKVYLASA